MTGTGVNRVVVAGLVQERIQHGETGSGAPACSFWLQNRTSHQVTSLKVNVYGPLALICKDRLRAKSYLVVDGELMNRSAASPEVEVRAHQLTFL